MAVSGNWILSLKVLLISAGLVSIAIMVSFSVPLGVDFVVHRIPVIWSTLLSWLRPPYLYFIVHGIIITIAASSRFHHHKHEVQSDAEHVDSSKLPQPDPRSDIAVSRPPEIGFAELPPAEYESEVTVPEEKTITAVIDGPEAEDEDEEEEGVVISKSNSSHFQTEFLFPTPEKPLVSSRFGHRKSIKASPEGGRALRVAKPKRHETLENTWKMITDGRPMRLTRHLKKSDSFGSIAAATSSELSQQDVKKSETFRHRANNDEPPSPKLRKEPSLSQDELNRRVEAFIRKFNEEMRLQRQESLDQYMEMINRGAH